MVLCKFFLAGACRFGSKCHNEHIDLKQLLRTDVESAINGRQWPFSCFGPFKDKPCIPDFVDDKSFEEVRYMSYEARKKNCFDNYHTQFTYEGMEAQNKMKALLQFTPEIMQVVNKIYESSAESQTQNTANPFGLGAPKMGNPFGTTSATASTPVPGGNLFGGTSLFGGGGNSASANAGASIFGGTAPAGPSIFGGGGNSMQQQQQPSLFGQAQAPATNSIFGGGAQQTSIFAQHPQQQQMNVTSNEGGLFAQASQQIQQQQQQQQQLQHQQQQQQQQQQQPNGFGIFAAAAQQTAPMFGKVAPAFGQQMAAFPPATNPHDASGLFAAASAETQSMFAQSQTHLQQPTNGFFQPGQQQQPQQVAQQQQQQQPANGNFSMSTYSRMEELTADEIEAFKADIFVNGKIPLNPPCFELIR